MRDHVQRRGTLAGNRRVRRDSSSSRPVLPEPDQPLVSVPGPRPESHLELPGADFLRSFFLFWFVTVVSEVDCTAGGERGFPNESITSSSAEFMSPEGSKAMLRCSVEMQLRDPVPR